VSKELKVGLFMLVSIAILYLGFNYLKGIDFFSSNDKYYALYENVDGLNVSNPVLVNGFIVGRVSKIRLIQEHRNRVMVELDIRGNIVLGDSTKAILTSDFLGNKSIVLDVGPIDDPIPPGDTLIAVLDRAITDILAESAQPVANNLEATIKKVNAILDNLGGNSEKINSIITELEGIPPLIKTTIRSTNTNLDQITTTFDHVGSEINMTMQEVRPVLQNMEQFTDSLNELELDKTVTKLNATIESLERAADQLSHNEGTLGKLIHSDSLYNNINRATLTLEELLHHLNTNPKHFFSPFGKSRRKIEKELSRQRD
jgi:phospholipid/cholesterol/gamma-HCH transport system substrate-binding protein